MGVAALLIGGALALALFCGRAAFQFMPALDLPRPLVADAPPLLGPAPPRLARRVVLVLVDGLRLDSSYGRPFLDRLRAAGIDASARSHFPTISLPNYVSVVTGMEPRWSGVRTNGFARPVRLDSVMARARAAGLRVAYVAHRSGELPLMFPEALDEGGLAPWPGGTERALANALGRGDELILWWIEDVDEAGHRFGAATPEYRTAARRVDQRLEALLASLDLERDAIVVVADHGHVDQGGHGGMEEEVVNVPLVLAGAGVRPGATLLDARLIDVAPTVAALLGLPAPAQAFGRVLTEALELDPAAADAVRAADEARLAALVPIAEDAVRDRRAVAVRARRAAAFGVGLGVLLAGGVWLARRGTVRIDRRVLLIAVPAFPLTFYSLLVVFESFLSPSMLPAKASIASKLLRYGAVAALIHLVAAWGALAGRVPPCERLAAAAGLVLVGLAVAVAPAGLAWALAEPTLAVDLPGPDLLMLPPVTYAAVSCYGASAVLTLAVEYAVFLARASDPRRHGA